MRNKNEREFWLCGRLATLLGGISTEVEADVEKKFTIPQREKLLSEIKIIQESLRGGRVLFRKPKP